MIDLIGKGGMVMRRIREILWIIAKLEIFVIEAC